jgi:hypothetical protein
LDEISRKLHISQQEEWYSVTKRQILENGGSKALSKSRSVWNALKIAYPEYDWHSLHYPLVHCKSFMDRLTKELQITEQSDWMKVTNNTIKKNGGTVHLLRFGRLARILEKVYPAYLWHFMYNREHAPSLLLARVWNENIDPTGYWISEKYDGCRAFWDGR